MKVEPQPRTASASAKGGLRCLKTVAHLIVGPARDKRCVVLSLSCGARLRPGYPQHYCTLRMPAARPSVAVPPVLPAGKEPRNFGLHRDKQLAVVRQLTGIIQRPPNAVPRPTIRQTKA